MITHKSYSQLTSVENLFQAWSEFKVGKRKRKDVQEFERNLEDNLFDLRFKLKTKTYRHGNYFAFYVHDPKQRHIHKASVQDRVVHHLLYQYLYTLFDSSFTFDSYSCRLEKGTHKGILRLENFLRKVSRNYTGSCWALKLDIRKFFANVDHDILMELLKRKINDKDLLRLLKEVIDSFPQGIPLGNLTSQIFANIYMNELDRFIKHKLKIKYYIRYADDFLILSINKNNLQSLIKPVDKFLQEKLKLELHPKKIILKRFDWGIDFLGYIVLPQYILPRTKTKKRMFRKLKEKLESENFNQSLQSYIGYLSHANAYNLSNKIATQRFQ
ncbi:MAG: RNA-directed DNA polymerase (Reverse transcriptase) [Microgenomates group bacterium Gr01-1014_7]|nr:MAG: RNA-directed DNA polymerase (Reverse transcriptase) [Microgenomates group bacterium Gr01-1014_7]